MFQNEILNPWNQCCCQDLSFIDAPNPSRCMVLFVSKDISEQIIFVQNFSFLFQKEILNTSPFVQNSSFLFQKEF